MAGLKRRAQGDPRDLDDAHTVAFRPRKSPVLSQLDRSRAAQCLQLVRALNSQFTSWVQNQLKEHADEIWQEGLQDYLRHASKILADFSDVAELSKASASTNTWSGNESGFQSITGHTTERRGESGSGVSLSGKESNVFDNQHVSPPSTTLFSTPGAPGLPMVNIPGKTSVTTRITTCNEGDNQEDGDVLNEPSSPSLKRSEEPGIKVVYEVKCKLYIKEDSSADKAWKDMGLANLTLKCKEGAGKGTKEAKATIVVRNDVGRVLLNALLYSNIKMNIQKNTVTGIFHSADTESGVQGGKVQDRETTKPRLYLLRLKTQSEAEKLVEAITANAPVAE